MPIVQAEHLLDQSKQPEVEAGWGMDGRAVVGSERKKDKRAQQLPRASNCLGVAVGEGRYRETAEVAERELVDEDGGDEKGRLGEKTDDRWRGKSVVVKNLKKKGPSLGLYEDTSSLRRGEQPWAGWEGEVGVGLSTPF